VIVAREGADMQIESIGRPTGSAVPGVIREPIHQRHPARSVFATLVSALRGDRYMVDAYPPDWRDDAPTHDAEPRQAAQTASALLSSKER
jgi:hypothetical protein